jgi:hypothetical protein
MVGSQNDILLRLIHIVPFAVGLVFGVLTIARSFKDTRITFIATVLAIALPNYIFYATNLRMYSLLFMTEMAFVDAVSRVTSTNRSPSNRALLWIVISGMAVISIDYAGTIYYAAGVLFLAVRSLTFGRIRPFVASLIPAGLLLWLVQANLHLVQNIAQWNVNQPQGSSWQGIIDTLKWLYLACRPALDIIYPPGLPLWLALAVPTLWLGLIL